MTSVSWHLLLAALVLDQLPDSRGVAEIHRVIRSALEREYGVLVVVHHRAGHDQRPVRVQRDLADPAVVVAPEEEVALCARDTAVHAEGEAGRSDRRREPYLWQLRVGAVLVGVLRSGR